MKYYFDTNIWIAALYAGHPRHDACKKIIENSHKAEVEIFTSGHCLAETYSVLTKLPALKGVSPKLIIESIEKSIVQKCSIIDLTSLEYIEVLKNAAEKGLISGAIFDGLHVKAALKAKVNQIFTYNLRDFERFDIPKEVILGEPE
jgi:predicted nucleic acid-binding protein